MADYQFIDYVNCRLILLLVEVVLNKHVRLIVKEIRFRW